MPNDPSLQARIVALLDPGGLSIQDIRAALDVPYDNLSDTLSALQKGGYIIMSGGNWYQDFAGLSIPAPDHAAGEEAGK